MYEEDKTMKKILPIIIILLISLCSCTKRNETPEPEVTPEPPAPPTLEERIENADYTVIAGKWVYLFSDGDFEYVEDADASSSYTTGEKIYDASEFSGEDAAYNFASAVVGKKPSALAYGEGEYTKYAVFDGQYFYFKAGDMTTWNLDIHADGFKDPYTFEKWDLCASEASKPTHGCDVSFAYTFGTISAQKGTELGFVTSGRLVSVRE